MLTLKLFLGYALISAVLIHGNLFAADDDVTVRVNQILAQANVHNPMPSVKALAKLGKPAIPVLLQRLPTYEFPIVIISALGRIKSPEAVPQLVQYLSHLDLKGKDNLVLIRAVLSTLSSIGDSRAEPELLKIVRNKDLNISVRLYAATTIARIGNDSATKEAQEFILNSSDIQKSLATISPVDLDTAYFEIGTKEAIEKLFQAIKAGFPYEQLFIIDLFAGHTTPQIIEGLLLISENAEYFPDVRFRALEILVKQKGVSKERLMKSLYALQKDAPEQGASKSLVTKAAVDALMQKLKKPN